MAAKVTGDPKTVAEGARRARTASEMLLRQIGMIAVGGPKLAVVRSSAVVFKRPTLI